MGAVSLREKGDASITKYSRMPKHYIVLDQNVLRSLELAELVTMNASVHFVLPDLAFFEMTKNRQSWEHTLALSLKILAPYRNRVHVAKSVSEALRMELARKVPVAGHMLYSDASSFARGVLHSVYHNTDGSELQAIRLDPTDNYGGMVNDYLNHSENKGRLADLIGTTKEMLPEGFEKQMRSRQVSREERLEMMRSIVPPLLAEILYQDFGFSLEKAWGFIKQKPMVLRYMYLKLWLCFDWLSKGGFHSLGSDKVTNDLLDHEYILTATYFNGLLSKEGRVKEAYQDMKELLSRPVARRSD